MILRLLNKWWGGVAFWYLSGVAFEFHHKKVELVLVPSYQLLSLCVLLLVVHNFRHLIFWHQVYHAQTHQVSRAQITLSFVSL